MKMDSRRLIRSVLLATLLWLATTSLVVGVAAAEGEDLFVPEPRPGDRATYRISQVILDPDTARGDLRALTEVTYAWFPEVTATNPEFAPRSGQVLRSAYVFGDRIYNQEAVYDGATGFPLYASQSASTTTDGTNYGLILEDLIGSEGFTTNWRAQWFDGALGPCGVRPVFTVPPKAGDIVPIAGMCDWPGGDDGSLYRADGWRTEGNRPAFRFTSLKDDALHLWYDGQSSFPLRIESPLADTVSSDYTFGRMFVLERMSFERGDNAYPAPQTAPGLGPAPLLPRPAWGVADNGIDHPFPLSLAYAAALSEEDAPGAGNLGNDPTVPEFLADHPGAYLGYASYTDLVDSQGEHHHTWWMIFTDGAERLGKRVELGPPGFSSIFLPKAAAGTGISIYDWEPSASYAPADVRGLFPPPTLLPDDMPSVEGLWLRYTAISGLEPNAYGFQLRCADPLCSATRAEALAGRSRGDLYGAFNVFGDVIVEHSSIWESIWVDAGGRLQRTYATATTSDTPIPLVPSGSGKDAPAQPVPVAWIPTTWSAGTQAAAAGLGVMALLAGVVYYVWPALKGTLGLGLFSRIEHGAVLEHPMRRRIYDAIGAEPGIHFQALARKAGTGRGALDHHLRKLVAAELVTVRRAPGFTCYFQKGTLGRQVLDAAPALRSDGSRAVLQAVAAMPGSSSRQLAAHLGVAPSTMSYHLKRLQDAGLVTPGEKSGVRVTALGLQSA